MSRLLRTAAAAALTLAAGLAVAGAASAQTYNRLVVFGDSLSDNGNLNAAVAYYGLLEGLKTPDLRPQDPIDFADAIKVPVLGLYSGIDAFVKQETIAKMRGLINKGGSGSEIVVFPNVDHGFNADYRPSYDKAAATYAQKLANDWFKKYRV